MFLSDSYTSHEAFVRGYKSQYNGKAKTEEFYLTELEKAIQNQVDLRDYYDNPKNPFGSTDLVILASKHNKVKILEYLFENDRGNLNNSPNYNAFYYALRAGNIEFLEILIKKWPNNYFADRSNELDEIISRTYEDLKLKNVPLSEEMEVFVENKLINFRFFSDSSEKDQKADKSNKNSNINERIELVLQSIESLKRDYSNMEEVDGEFLFIARSIAQNIHILKGLLNSTYDILPWEEMEFCLVSFVSSFQKRQEINLFYRATLNKWKLLKHLENFATKLEDEKGQPQRSKPEKVVDRKFEELYNDYQQIKEVHSLLKIRDHIKKSVLSANPNKKNGQLIITKFISDHLKGALEFSKLSNNTLHNLLSLLFEKFGTEEIGDFNFFPNVHEDIRKVGNEITYILNELNNPNKTEMCVNNNKLISLRSFFISSGNDGSSQDDNDKDTQIQLILQSIESLKRDYSNAEEVDEKFY